MTNHSDDRSVIDAERLILRALCQESCPAPARESAKSALADYRWREPVHEIIFSFVVVQPATAPIPMGDQLPGLLTRKGFPDVDWELFFQPASISETKLADLVRELAASNEAGPKPGPT
ncbi:MAG: hypothetical protein ACYDA9_08615 [Terriglobia bacterium]